MIRVRPLHAALIAVTLAGCGGGSSLQGTPPAGLPALPGQPATSAVFRILVPSKPAQGAIRSPKYVSASTQSVVVTLTSVNGKPYVGVASSPSTIATNLTPSSPSCTTGASGLTCNAPAPAVAGTDIYTVSTYDATQSSSSPSTPAGRLLSQGSTALTIVAGQSNTGNLTLSGVVASVTVAFAANTHVAGSQASGFSVVGNQPRTFTVSAQDPDGNTIVGAGAPTFVVTSGNAAVAIAPTATTGTYTAQVQTFSSTPVQVTVTPSTGAAVHFNVMTVQELWIGNSSGNNVVAYNASTRAQISGDTITGLSGPFMVQTGPNGNLWISNFSGNQIEEVVPETNTALFSNGGATSGIDGPFGIAFDSSGNMYLCLGQGESLQKYTAASFAGLTGAHDIAPVASTTVSLSDPVQSAFGSNGVLWVANDGSISVSAYDSALNNVALIEGPKTLIGAPTGVGFDEAGHLWVVDNANSGLLEFNTAGLNLTNGNIAPLAIIAGSATGLNLPVAIAFDAGGNAWVTSNHGQQVLEFAAGSLAAGGNLTPIGKITGLNGPSGVTFTP